MTTRHLSLVSSVFVALLVATACSALPAGPGKSATPAPVTPSASPAPSTSPGSSPGVSPSTVPSPQASAAGGVSSAAQAAALVLASNPLFNSIRPLNPLLVGQASWYEAYASTDGFAVSVTMGSGDCQSGCINRHTWHYAVRPDGGLRLVSEEGDEVEVAIDHGTADAATVAIRLLAAPMCPVEHSSPDPSCAPRPVADAEVVLRDPSGKEVGRDTAGDDGSVAFTVPGGAYYAEAAAVEGLIGQAQAVAFSVPGGRSITVAMQYDTGIR